MVRRLLAATLFLVCTVAGGAHAAKSKLNVLMIIVDDLAPVVSAYGGPVSTPALDQLAAQGVRFSNNYANVPVCGASRASLLSGLAPSSTRFLSYDSRLDEDAAGAVSLPAYFREHGWHTLANGKVFDVIADSADSWTEPVWSPEDAWYGVAPDERGEHLQGAYINPVPSGRTPYFEKLEVADTGYPDGQVAAKSVTDLQRLAAQRSPFFLAVGFRKPHLPFNAPQRYWEPTRSPEDALPQTWWSPGANIPEAALHRSPELRARYDALPFFGDPSDVAASEIVAAYHAAVRYVDAQVGLVLQGLEDSGVADNTLIVLLGDHGFFLGQQRLWTKHALLEPALRTPLMIAGPAIRAAQEALAVSDLLDVFPTIVDLAGLEIPAQAEGASLRPVLENPALAERSSKPGSISRWMNGESLRQNRFRYTRWFDEQGQTTDEMLFDLASDPYEQANLAGLAEHAALKSRLRAYLDEHRSGPVWSEGLGEQLDRWRLASSIFGGMVLVALAYPIPVIVGLVIVLVATVFLLLRRRRMWCSEQRSAAQA